MDSGATGLSEVARETGLDRKTVRKYLSAPGPATPPRRSPNGRSKARVIDEFAPLVDSMQRAEILMKAAVIHERLTAQYGFTGNYQRTKLYVQEARPRIAEELGITPKELAGMHRRFEVIPGALAQVDWGDEVLATAILDRLLHHCEVISVNGPSYRLKNRLKAIERETEVA